MPRSKVINRRNVHPLRLRSIAVSDEAMAAVRELAARLEVSQGSLVDTAMRALVGLPPDRVVELMRQHKHLGEDEYAYVRRLLDPETSRRSRARQDSGADSGRDGGADGTEQMQQEE